MMSLQQRLALGSGLVLALLLLLLGLVVHGSAQQMMERYVAARLEHDAESLLASLRLQNGTPQVDESLLSQVYLRPFSGHYFRVDAGGATLRSRSLWDADLHVEEVPVSGASRVFHLQGPNDQPLLVFQRTYVRQGRPAAIAVAEDLTDLRAELGGFRQLLLAMILFSLLSVLGLQALVVRRGLEPLERVRRDVARLERGEIARVAETVPTEVGPLVHEINHLLELTARRLERSRHALGNLTHALKTPLSVLVQLADRRDDQDIEALRATLGEQTHRIGELVDRELKRARLSGAASPGQRFRPADELPHLVRAIEGIYRNKGLHVECRLAPDATIAADRDDMLELVGNLLDNAAKWATGRVRLSLGPGPGLELRVEDDGPGAPPETLSELAGRGVRVDEATAGHGLGLAIVRAVIQDYGGSLALGRSEELGGFSAEVHWTGPG